MTQGDTFTRTRQLLAATLLATAFALPSLAHW